MARFRRHGVNVVAYEPGDAAADASPPRQQVEIAPESIERAAGALFVLWLKIGATLVVAKLVVLVWPVIVLLILSLMLVTTFNPLVRRLQKRLTRAWAITAVVVGLVVTSAGMLTLMIPPLVEQGRQLLVNLPRYLTDIEASARHLGIPVRLHGSALDLSKRAASLGPDTLNVLWTIFSGV